MAFFSAGSALQGLSQAAGIGQPMIDFGSRVGYVDPAQYWTPERMKNQARINQNVDPNTRNTRTFAASDGAMGLPSFTGAGFSQVDPDTFAQAMHGLQRAMPGPIVINPTPHKPQAQTPQAPGSQLQPTGSMVAPMPGGNTALQRPRKGKDVATINRGPEQLGGMGGDPRAQAMRGLASRIGGAY